MNRYPRGARGPLSALMLLSLGLACVGQAHAQGQIGPNPDLDFEGTLDYAATAASLLTCQPGSCDMLLGQGERCQGLNQAPAQLTVIPDLPGLSVRHARVFWVATTAAGDPPDRNVTLTPPAGAPIPVAYDDALSTAYVDGLPAAECDALEFFCPGIACDIGFYMGVADVTDQLNVHLGGGGALNGEWLLSDIDVAGSPSDDPDLAVAGLASIGLGAWAILIVYEHDDLPLRRLYYYEGFEEVAGEERRVRPRGFRAPPNAAADITYLVLEGDSGIQGDTISVNGVELQNACNPRRNVFNSTVNGHRADGVCEQGQTKVDLDRFDVIDVIEPMDEEAEVVFNAGAGEQIFPVWLMLGFDHIPAAFGSVKPEKSAEPPHRSVVPAGSRIDYVILVENSGGDFAANVTVQDGIPAGTVYVAGSTTVDALAIADSPGGRSPLLNGLNLATLPGIDVIGPGDRHFVRFSVTVADVPPSTEITNIASIIADGIEETLSDPVVHTTSAAADGGPPPPPPVDMGAEPDMDASVEPEPQPEPQPTADMGRCPPGQRLEVNGFCRDIECADGSSLVDGECAADQPNPCGPGQALIDGRCEAICGDGLRWDPTCEGAGQCRYVGDPPCAEGASGDDEDGCGCDVGQGGSPVHLLWLTPLMLGAVRRRRMA
ncbi:MAG: putative repeat protein (TIGR01451 family) [Bradymonadia bacterium]|jgi:uncharacterized repeat protein (TIGR01451 family)